MGIIFRAGGMTKICRTLPGMSVTMILYITYVQTPPTDTPHRHPTAPLPPQSSTQPSAARPYPRRAL